MSSAAVSFAAESSVAVSTAAMCSTAMSSMGAEDEAFGV